MKANPLVSVIVPVYNIEKYIGDCLESLINQTYKNIEIIVIDDRSNDKSLSICKKYSSRDKRIKILRNKNNLGLSLTRNVGIKKAKGDCVTFVDGDDWLDKECIEKCVEGIILGSDIVFFPFKKEYIKRTIRVDIFDGSRSFSKKEIKEVLLRKLFGLYRNELKHPARMDNFSSAWGKMYKRTIIGNNEFIDTKKVGTEDGIMNIACFKNAKKVTYIDSIFYHYRKNNTGSLTHTYDIAFFDKCKNLYGEMYKHIEDTTHEEALNNRIVINTLGVSLKIMVSDLTFLNRKKELDMILADDILRAAFEKFNFKYLSTPWKIYYRLCKSRISMGVIVLDSMILFYKKLKWGNV